MRMKIQRPIFPTDQTLWLFYNKSRTIEFQAEPNPKVKKMMGDDLKMYVTAKLKKGVVTILRRIKDQPW